MFTSIKQYTFEYELGNKVALENIKRDYKRISSLEKLNIPKFRGGTK